MSTLHAKLPTDVAHVQAVNAVPPGKVEWQQHGYEEPVEGHDRDSPDNEEGREEDGMSHVREEALLLGRLVVQRVGEPMVGVVDLGREENKIEKERVEEVEGMEEWEKKRKVCAGKGIEGERCFLSTLKSTQCRIHVP